MRDYIFLSGDEMGSVLMNPLDIKLCNCARCRKELLGESMRSWHASLPRRQRDKLELPQFVYARMEDRPYCIICAGIILSKTSSVGKVGI